ncbi:glutamate-tRNA ligase [Cyathus striatus]|nr:glutamate-tRNA ligase [Cyathus striatus]
MAAVLTLPSKQSPFPFATIAVTAYTQSATVVFDETAQAPSLQINSSTVTDQDEIVQILAKEGRLFDDSVKAPAFFALAKSLRAATAFPDIDAALHSLDNHLLFAPSLLATLTLSHTVAKASKARNTKTAASFALGLQNAEEGKVVTRFPPEPSGYLHIGHAKAAILNNTLPRCTKGNLSFLAVKLIKSGKAYADDTDQETMRKQRWDGIPSVHRDDSVEDNLKHFEEMKSGSTEGQRWCIRAKMSVDDPNKALRDPVIFRCNMLPHHRTGDKWKIYPTYDFACPVVDSIEGVTHALRTNEYRDRNPQYQWMIEALGLRKVDIWDFSRLNFIYTLLSKRKLHWFVDNGLVGGWDDPRFPTVRGIRRRGMTVEALTQFMLAQGPSQAVVSLEWDSIWTLNKKIIDPIAPRHWAIVKDKAQYSVPVTINGGPSTPEVKSVPKHKKNVDIGEKKTVYTSNILIEQDDAASFDDREEVTLMDWGNAIVKSKTVDASGVVTAIEMDLNLEGDFRKTKKKITWLAQPTAAHPLPSVTLIDFDYLITKKKLEENDNVADFITPVTEFKEHAYADANVKDLKKGDIMQFERKGYYIFDKESDGVLEFFRIPDGRAAGIASKATPTPAAPAVSPLPAVDQPVTNMYQADRVYGEDVNPDIDTKMYAVESIYKS